MQTTIPIEFVALLLVAFGTLILIAGLVMMMKPRNGDGAQAKRESKGIVLLGPIPIVWGFGGRTLKAISIIAVLAFALYLVLVLL